MPGSRDTGTGSSKEGFNGRNALFSVTDMAEEMYAFSRLEGAFQRTKSLLWPPQWGIWLRLAVIALFVGGGASFPNVFQYDYGGATSRPALRSPSPRSRR